MDGLVYSTVEEHTQEQMAPFLPQDGRISTTHLIIAVSGLSTYKTTQMLQLILLLMSHMEFVAEVNVQQTM